MATVPETVGHFGAGFGGRGSPFNLIMSTCLSHGVRAPFSHFTRTAVSSAPIAVICRARNLIAERAIWRRRRRRAGDSRSAATVRAPTRARRPSAHPPGLSAAVDPIRAMPEGSLAVGASVSDCRDFILAEVYHRLVDHSVLGEDLASEALADAGAFVGEGLDLSGDEPYSRAC